MEPGSAAAKNDIEAPAAAMPPMRAANGGNPRRMTRDREPIVDGGTDPPALDWRFSGPGMAGN